MASPLLTLCRGDSLTAWEISAETARHFPGEPAPSHDPQNYRYVNGFVDVGDLPCRLATWRDVAGQTPALDHDWAVERLLLPGTSRSVDFNQFRYRPTRLSRWCRTRVTVPADRYCTFNLSTRGGVHIWIDGALAARFEPFSRNVTQTTQVHLPLRAAGSEIVVFTEDMAERDTNWFFELALLDDTTIEVFLEGAAAGSHVETLRKLAAEIRQDGEFAPAGGALALIVDTPLGDDVQVHAVVSSPSHTREIVLDARLVLAAGSTRLVLCPTAAIADGFYNVTLDITLGDTQTQRKLACMVLQQDKPRAYAADLSARKAEALLYASQHGEDRMGTVLAMLASGAVDAERLRRIVETTLVAVTERHDCADFETVYLAWIYRRYADHLPADLRAAIRAALIGFRYWVDEPGNDVMWFWSENHALCFHVSQLLAGQAFPDEVFIASDRTGREQAALAADRLGRWFDAIEEEGLAEWNSAAYYPVDFIGLLALAELAGGALAQRAAMACDRIFRMVALHSLGGVPAGSMGRAYDKELQAGALTELAPFITVALGEGWLNRGVAALPMLAAGGYEPPADLSDLAAPAAGEAITASYVQGYGPAALLTVHKTRHVQLSSNAGAQAGGYGHQQHVIDVLLASHPMARSWINHPGDDDPFGQQRPSYWAGNGMLPRVAQAGDTGLVLYNLGAKPRLPFTHIYAARSGLTHHLYGDILILQSGSAMVGYKATAPLQPMLSGPCQGIEYRLDAKLGGYAVVVMDGDDVGAMLAWLKGAALTLSPGGDTLDFQPHDRQLLSLSWGDGLSVAGTPRPHPNLGVEPLVNRTRG